MREPAFAQERLAWTDDGRIAYRLKRPWPDGRTELVLEPVAFLRRLCGIDADPAGTRALYQRARDGTEPIGCDALGGSYVSEGG